jgi:hypothetical protein
LSPVLANVIRISSPLLKDDALPETKEQVTSKYEVLSVRLLIVNNAKSAEFALFTIRK